MPVLKCLKLFRIIKAVRILGELVEISAEFRTSFNVAIMILLIVYVSHILACLFSGVARVSMDENNYFYVEGSENWLSAQDLIPACSTPKIEGTSWPAEHTDQFYREYITAFYWAIMTLTTVGYGDVSASNNGEMCFSAAVMIFGAIFYAVVLGSVTKAIDGLGAADASLVLRIQKAEQFVKRYKLSDDLAIRLKQSVKLQDQWRTEFDELFECCHPEFRMELLMSIHRPVLIQTTFFSGIDEGFLKLIVSELQIHVCLEDDCIYSEGNNGDCMFILNQGFVGTYSSAINVSCRVTCVCSLLRACSRRIFI